MGTFGQRLRELRNQRGISQNELSKYIGVSKSSVNMYERGEREPGFETLEAIADFFNVNMDYLLGRESEKPPTDSLSKISSVTSEFNPAEFSAPARELLAKLFAALAYGEANDFFLKYDKEVHEFFTLSNMQYLVTFLDKLCTAFTEVAEQSDHAEQAPPPEDE